MAKLSVKYGSEYQDVDAYQKDNKWYRCDNNELINPDNIHNVE